MSEQQSTFGLSAYGGAGWSPRSQGLETEIGGVWGACGIDSEWRTLRSVLLHRPGAELEASLRIRPIDLRADQDPARGLLSRALSHERQKLEAVDVRHVDVDDHHVERVGSKQPKRLEAGFGFLHSGKARVFQRRTDECTHGAAVIHNESVKCHSIPPPPW